MLESLFNFQFVAIYILSFITLLIYLVQLLQGHFQAGMDLRDVVGKANCQRWIHM